MEVWNGGETNKLVVISNGEENTYFSTDLIRGKSRSKIFGMGRVLEGQETFWDDWYVLATSILVLGKEIQILAQIQVEFTYKVIDDDFWGWVVLNGNPGSRARKKNGDLRNKFYQILGFLDPQYSLIPTRIDKSWIIGEEPKSGTLICRVPVPVLGF